MLGDGKVNIYGWYCYDPDRVCKRFRHKKNKGYKKMTPTYGFGMLMMGVIAIAIASIIIYFIFKKIK